MWDTNFVKTLNNKDCHLRMKPFYMKNLAHACQIWDTYEWPGPNL